MMFNKYTTFSSVLKNIIKPTLFYKTISLITLPISLLAEVV